MSIFDKIFDKNKMLLKKYSKVVEKINSLEPSISKLTQEEFLKKTEELKKAAESSPLEDLIPEAFALVREAAKRTTGMRAFDVQLMGAMALNEGKIAEMKTGEGKTLVATMPLYLNALTGKGCHLATVNDYLAKRDAGWMGPVYEYLGMKAGFIQASMDPVNRKEAYNCDITYGTANEFGFDYLRDNLVYSLENKVQRGHNFVIVDEADSILIDEARTPLIISGPAEDSSSLYRQFAFFAKRFQQEKDFLVDEKDRTVTLTDEGIAKAEKLLQIDNLYDPSNYDYLFHLLNALKAMTLYRKEVDYLVSQEGEVVIVDEFTGRLLQGRRYSEGLHQAIEAKENVQIRQESVTFATITFQNYFKLYEKVSGMTGTAATEEAEFISMYNTPVAVIPTNREVVRVDKEDLIYKSREEKNEAIIEEIVRRYEKGQPVLVGTTSIEKSEQLSNLLKKKGVPHEVLNAKYHEREAEIVAKAGQAKTVTIATNMAGRGTDIKLGEGVVDLGGLFVLGTERHESRRIDNQLVGRSGRQGDPGESRFYLSTEDDLLRLFGGERMQSIMTTLKIERGQPIEHPLLSRIISSSQKKIEGIHFEIRKRLFELDSVMDQQRSAIYAHRDWVLKGEELDSNISEIIHDVVERRVDGLQAMPSREEIRSSFAFLSPDSLNRLSESKTIEELKESAIKLLEDTYQEKKKSFGKEFPQVMKYIMLRMIDERWRRHLESVDHLKDSVGLRAYGQKDPVIEFKKESYELFQQLTDSLYDDIASAIVRIVKVDSDKAQQKADKEFKNLQAVHSEFGTAEKKSDSSGKKKSTKRFKVKR
ncbi:MAG TPA: preprotein translocase subunit SecA [Mesotoga infera]|uniref:Protein translocase subunit SecA n=1 Tax=Mesotoga infera TaxID=1236046 RepID=A0A7Z7LDY6_9BACT|nr:preprotein translocase subunit SecA [Mesotoga infera]MBP8659515.1 preprotein translocase subunit SecA [Mesotoga sp.]SSC11811.1 Protein translocase subunit SecA [Mesotoga infera]HON27419.1 preprotein translocase subunit SecA [Mesotoga infera]HPD36785.1 preprotein translocase subunit SecA [Mesotoga infera]HRR43582.1 preprotein translocase subunit SecA [Mesotoga sp.]